MSVDGGTITTSQTYKQSPIHISTYLTTLQVARGELCTGLTLTTHIHTPSPYINTDLFAPTYSLTLTSPSFGEEPLKMQYKASPPTPLLKRGEECKCVGMIWSLPLRGRIGGGLSGGGDGGEACIGVWSGSPLRISERGWG